MEVAKTLHEKISKFCQVTLDSCAYAGTGNVLKVLIFVLLSYWAMGFTMFSGRQHHFMILARIHFIWVLFLCHGIAHVQ
jgi:hypothetical protein